MNSYTRLLVSLVIVAFVELECYAKYIESPWLGIGELQFYNAACFAHRARPSPMLIDGVDCEMTDHALNISNEASVATKDEKVTVICDVVSINLISIDGLDEAIRFRRYDKVVAWHRVFAKVRESSNDIFSAKWFSFPVCVVVQMPEWPFYKGLTYALDLSCAEGVWRVDSYELVNPFPPFERQGVNVIFSGYETECSEINSFCKSHGIQFEKEEKTALQVSYPDGSVVLCISGFCVSFGDPMIKVYDFSSSKFYLLSGNSDSGNLYWSSAWIADARDGDEPFLKRIELIKSE